MIEDPIRQLLAEGRKVSSGGFTMDLLAAQRKLSKVAELEPGLMLGKVIQAAVVAQATQVRFALSARDIVAKINFPEAARTDQEVQEHMATAFALAQGLRPRGLTWTCGGVTRSFVGRVSGEGALRTEGLAVFRFEGRYTTLWEELRALVVARRDAACLLRERAYLCSIPVFVDAVRVNHPAQAGIHPGCDVLQLSRRGNLPRNQVLAPSPRACQAHKVLLDDETYLGKSSFGENPSPMHSLKTVILEGAKDPDVVERKIPDREQFDLRNVVTSPGLALCNHVGPGIDGLNRVSVQTDWINPEAYLSPETTRESFDPTLYAQRWISRLDKVQRPSELWPVQDGLLLNKVLLPNCPVGFRVIIPVRDMKLDLDQLNVLQDEVFQKLQEQLNAELKRLSALWEKLQEKPWQRPTTV